MKKIVNVHFRGFTYIIEEEAYDVLKKYLSDIETHLGEMEGKSEILEDIEARIVELLSSRKSPNAPCTMEDIEFIMEAIGAPSTFGSEQTEYEPQSGGKKLFLDPRDRMIGGVCSGFGHYFRIDPIWFRILFVLLVIGGGFGLLVYLILWALIPEAKTPADFLKMENSGGGFESGFKEPKEFKEMKAKFHQWKNSQEVQEAGNGIRNILNQLALGIRKFLQVFGKVIGIVLVIACSFAIISWIAAFAGMGDLWHMAPFHEADWLLSTAQPHPFWPDVEIPLLATYAVWILVLTPLILLIYAGLRMIRPTINVQGFTLILSLIFALGLGLMIYSGVAFGKHFSATAYRGYFGEALPVGDTLILQAMEHPDLPHKKNNHDLSVFNNHFLQNDRIHSRNIELDIQQSEGDSAYYRIRKSALGRNKKETHRRLDNIQFSSELEENTWTLSNTISYPLSDQIRGQNVKITLFLPVGKTIYLHPSSRSVIYDIDNTSNTHDRRMTGKYWTMLPAGLSCLSCSPHEI